MTTININNKIVENFLYKQATEKNVSTVDYLTSLLMQEMEFLEIKKDIKNIENEIKQVNRGELKLKTADSLLSEL